MQRECEPEAREFSHSGACRFAYETQVTEITTSPSGMGHAVDLLVSSRRRPIALRILALGLIAIYASGCLSHEYVVPRDELTRLASQPPETRGQRVRAVQDIGIRRAPALDPEAPPPAAQGGGGPVYTNRGVATEHHHSHVFVGGVFHGGGGGGGPRPPVVAGPLGPTAQIAGPSVGAPVAPTPPAGVPAPAPSSGSPIGGASVKNNSGSKEEMLTYAVIAIVVASMAAVGAALTEGMRFDGDVSAAPGQLLYLQDPKGGERPVPISQLTMADLTGTERAVLRDDEGFGLVRVERAPLNRKGFAFKVDVGSLETRVAGSEPLGIASHVQFGYFPHHRLGLLGGVSLAGAGGEDGFARHAVTLEAQAFPINFWRIHLGATVHGGSAVTTNDDGPDPIWGIPTFGGGPILEIALTTRLALTARFDWSVIRKSPGDWSSARAISGGLAIY